MDRHLSVYRHFSTQLLLFRPTVSPSHPTVRRMQHCTFLVPTLPRPALLLYNPPRPHSTSYIIAIYSNPTLRPQDVRRSRAFPIASHGTVFSLTLVLLIVLHLIDRMSRARIDRSSSWGRKQCWVLKWCGAAARRVDGGLDAGACETAKGDRCRRCPASCGSSAVCTILRGCCLAGFRDVLPEIPSRSVAGARNLIRIIFPSRDGMARFIRFRRFSGNGTFLKSQGHFYLHTTPVLPALIASYWRRLMPSDQLVGNRTGVCLGVQSWIHSLPRISRLGYY
ncbi:hypothetical protein B0H13DRAFT_2056016 [Mycena leptocephala]|nr:hypothetical protein B0H13DRAFT_2056016 [Mycena leptocephala]